MSGVRKLASGAVRMGAASRPLDRSPTGPAIAVDMPPAGAEDIYKQAYLEGFAAGEEDGRREAERQASESLKRLEEARSDVEAVRRGWQESLLEAMEQFTRAAERQAEAVERLAADVAEIAVRRIVGRLHAERRAVEAACREALRDLHIESAQVRVSPCDREAFAEVPTGIELVADSSLEAGSCLIRSSLGDVDAGLATQLANLREALAGTLAEGRP
ncbi:FliH/SctL family protein [Fulvimonas yonginensis]|uniref:Flagellar assembly protein FliH n=1 Tax=Fulvimonas yonginensis TaxID=1495200 RepID=A0ABU8JD44_9GAMM